MSSAQIEALIGALPMPALFIDRGEHIIASNVSAKNILGEGLTGRNYITALRQPAVLSAIERCMQNEMDTRARYLGSDGPRDTSFELRCAYVTAQGLTGALVTFTDVTDLEQTNQMRRDFVANVSHELRTPLTSVIGFIETLQGPAKDDAAAQTRFLGIMARETARMNRLVDELLSLSRVESDARKRPTQQVDLAALLNSVVHTLGALAEDSQGALTLSILPDAEDLSLAADADQLQQVFTNLIENAVKYGGAGVRVTVTLHGPRFEPRLRRQGARISVRDTGVGFDPVHIPRLTERFYRIDSHRSREMGGAGLGLAIVKHIINRHRGRLEVHSALGQGSEFIVVLPLSND